MSAPESASLIAGGPEGDFLSVSADESQLDSCECADAGSVAQRIHQRRQRRWWSISLSLAGAALVFATFTLATVAARGYTTEVTSASSIIEEAEAQGFSHHREIPGSTSWWSCRHQQMYTCGKSCCCNNQFEYSTLEAACLHVRQIPGSKSWMTCGAHMEKCGHHCCCVSGYTYTAADQKCHNPINDFNNHLDSGLLTSQRGLYYAFETAAGQPILETRVQSTLGGWAESTSSFPLASASKLFTAFAAMRTMELKPRDFFPEKKIHLFKGWETFKQFSVHGSSRKADLTIHHLLTHTSGLPFAMRDSKEDIAKLTLFYQPGTKFGYTLGHRVLGWIMRDYWMQQPEGKKAGIRTVQDTYKFLIFDKLGLSAATKFDTSFELEFGTSGEAGDAALASTGEDMMKLAAVALRRGRLPNGQWMISEANWNRWAIPNLLPGGKLSKDLVDWQGKATSWADWNVVGMKSNIMKQSGDYGWNYFGATYFESREIGWCGFFSSCLRVSYPQGIAFVMMQRDVADLKKSKPYVINHFNTMAVSLQCKENTCGRNKGPQLFCQKCTTKPSCSNLAWNRQCPSKLTRSSSLLVTDTKVDPGHMTCYLPTCGH